MVIEAVGPGVGVACPACGGGGQGRRRAGRTRCTGTQLWDIRFDNQFALAPAVHSLYLEFLRGRGGMFLMAENSKSASRNNSVLALIRAAGGGTLSMAPPFATLQTGHAPAATGGAQAQRERSPDGR